MKGKYFTVSVVLILAIGMLSSQAFAGSWRKRVHKPVYYLSLGTSLAAGEQANPETCIGELTEVSYPGVLADYLSQDIRNLRHMNLGCQAETSVTFIEGGGRCEYPAGSQLNQALKFLKSRRGHFTGLITIDLGANDILECVTGTEVDAICLGDRVTELAENLAYVLETLRESAGPDVPIVGMNYYNPLLIYWNPEDPSLAEQTIELQMMVNGTLEGVYAAFGVPVANVAGAFMSYDLDTDNMPSPNGNGMPDSLDLLCTWTWMCPPCYNIHPNEAGYQVIADTFMAVMPEIHIPKPPWRACRHKPSIFLKDHWED